MTTGAVLHRSQSPFRNTVSFALHYKPVKLIKDEEIKVFPRPHGQAQIKSMLLQTRPCCLFTWTSVKPKKVSLTSSVSVYWKSSFLFHFVLLISSHLHPISIFWLPFLLPLSLKGEERQQKRPKCQREPLGGRSWKKASQKNGQCELAYVCSTGGLGECVPRPIHLGWFWYQGKPPNLSESHFEGWASQWD